MTQPAKSQEPSMEEILASIRRIIADDDAKAAAAAPPPPRQTAPPPPAPQPAPTPPRAESAPLPKQAGLKQDEIDLMMKAETVKPPAAPEAPAEVVNLTESMIAPMSQTGAPVAAKFQTIDAEPDVVFKEPEPASPAVRRYPEPPQQISEPLISGATSAAINSAFNTLAHTVLVQNARTLEDLVREMLRPMLKTWLDDNLPGIVERLVRAEIERVSRGRP
jgi:cell pole-organizing protein PopZ